MLIHIGAKPDFGINCRTAGTYDWTCPHHISVDHFTLFEYDLWGADYGHHMICNKKFDIPAALQSGILAECNFQNLRVP